MAVRCPNCHSHVCMFVHCLCTESLPCLCSVWWPRSSRWSLLVPPGDKCASPTHSSCLRPGLFTCTHNTDGVPLTRKGSLHWGRVDLHVRGRDYKMEKLTWTYWHFMLGLLGTQGHWDLSDSNDQTGLCNLFSRKKSTARYNSNHIMLGLITPKPSFTSCSPGDQIRRFSCHRHRSNSLHGYTDLNWWCGSSLSWKPSVFPFLL